MYFTTKSGQKLRNERKNGAFIEQHYRNFVNSHVITIAYGQTCRKTHVYIVCIMSCSSVQWLREGNAWQKIICAEQGSNYWHSTVNAIAGCHKKIVLLRVVPRHAMCLRSEISSLFKVYFSRNISHLWRPSKIMPSDPPEIITVNLQRKCYGLATIHLAPICTL
jgi:hypothetical protein